MSYLGYLEDFCYIRVSRRGNQPCARLQGHHTNSCLTEHVFAVPLLTFVRSFNPFSLGRLYIHGHTISCTTAMTEEYHGDSNRIVL